MSDTNYAGKNFHNHRINPDMKMTINPAYHQLTAFVESIPQRFHTEGETIYKSRNEIKVFDVNGLKINVKQYKAPFFFNRIVYTFFRPSKAYRAYTYAFRMLALGFETPTPIALMLLKKAGLIHRSYFISIQAPFSRNMYEFGKGRLDGRTSIIRHLALYTAKLHDAGIYHKDFSPGNILFQQTGDDVQFSLVDINRMQFGQVSIQKGCANFARLWGCGEMFRLLAKEYAIARHADIDECTRWVFYYRKRFWKKFSRKRTIPFDLSFLSDGC